MKSICLARREEFGEECLGAVIRGVHYTLVSIKPLLRSSHKREWKQSKPYRVLRDSLDNKGNAKLQELLEMSADILIGLATERLAYTIVMRPILISKFSPVVPTSGPTETLVADGAEKSLSVF